MTGTSLDGLDCALVRVEGEGLGMRAAVARFGSEPLGELAGPLRGLATQQPMTAGEISRLVLKFGEMHAEALRRLIGNDRVDLVAVHGQTVFHQPPYSWQMMNPWPIAQGLRVPVVFDLRGADLASGGQGAPITPLADYVLFRGSGERRTVVNLGGFANFTTLPGTDAVDQVEGGDICVCNQLLDAVARRAWEVALDEGGHRAAAGRVNQKMFDQLTGMLKAQSGAQRSLGTGDELAAWLDGACDQVVGEDMACTACAGIASVIAGRVGRTDRVIVAGGGAYNQTLVGQIRDRCGVPVLVSDDLGVPVQSREAAEIAVLGALCQDRVPITLRPITGYRGQPMIAGCWVCP